MVFPPPHFLGIAPLQQASRQNSEDMAAIPRQTPNEEAKVILEESNLSLKEDDVQEQEQEQEHVQEQEQEQEPVHEQEQVQEQEQEQEQEQVQHTTDETAEVAAVDNMTQKYLKV